ncbi:condensation domain-containing protein, partial [Streptomyces doebereineriae]
HLALTEIHHLAGHERLFDTLFLYESYPIDTAAFMGVQELTVTEFNNREYNHYPLSMMALPGHELGLRLEFDSDVFDARQIEALVERFQRLLVDMIDDPARRLSAMDVLESAEHDRLDTWSNREILARPVSAPVSIPEMFSQQVERDP